MNQFCKSLSYVLTVKSYRLVKNRLVSRYNCSSRSFLSVFSPNCDGVSFEEYHSYLLYLEEEILLRKDHILDMCTLTENHTQNELNTLGQ